ncbi:MAG: radical SAM protein, partial [Spirochaetota bacterium]
MINKIDSKFLNQKYYKNNTYKDKFENILQKVFKPARYIGVEPYSIHKYRPIELEEKLSENINNKIFQNDHSTLDGKNYYYVALTYPDMYEIGMSNLTIKYFYYFINDIKNAICERVFLPDEDLNRLLIEQDIPLLSLESWTPIKNFDLWAFTLQTELTYSNILFLFKLAKISPLSFQRDEEDPIIIVGGVSNFNPLPLSPFVDLFFLGEGEEAIKEIVNLDKENKVKKLSREERIKKLTEIEGVFSFNQIILNHYNDFKNKYPYQKNDNSFDKEKKETKDEDYSPNKEEKEIKNEDYSYNKEKNEIKNEDNSSDNEKKEIKNENIANINDFDLKFFEFLKDEVKFPEFKEIDVKKRVVKDLNKVDYPLVNILPLVQPIQDRLSVEVSRGCLNGCRFCQASFVYRPYREKDPIEVAIFAAKSLFLTGYEECNLTSLSISDYSNVKELIRSMEKYFKDKNISISVPSLRVASFDLDLFDSLSSVRKAGLTFAVEAGCEKIRNKINKEFDEDKFFEIVGSLYARGWKLVKLYFIIG